MGLINFFDKRQKEREKKQGFKQAFNREEQDSPNPLGGYFEKRHMNERIEKARMQSFEKEKIRQARQKGKQQAQGRGFGLKGFAQGAVGVAREIGSLAPPGGGMFDLPGRQGSSMFDFGMPKAVAGSQQYKKKHKGKKVTIYLK